jgi:DNA-binding GntR family transcriptional regulator
VSISLSAIARDFEVSRVHVRRMIQNAVSAGFLERVGADRLKVSPRLAAAVRRVVATYMLHYTHCARLAHADMAQESAVA